jgi:hypothetical protein
MSIFKKKVDKFTIKYYELSARYVSLCNGYYLKNPRVTSEYIELDDDLMFAAGFKTYEEAKLHIEKFKEQRYSKCKVFNVE